MKKVTVIIIWHPNNENVCPSSIAKYFSNISYNVHLCEPKTKSLTNYCVKVPLLDLENFEQDDCEDFMEWLGMLSIQANMENDNEEYISSYETPEPNKELGQVKVTEWRGFYSNKQIAIFFSKLR